MKQAKLTLTPMRSALLAGHDNKLDVLVRVTAPCEKASQRAPLNLSIVLDRSGSMQGQPLEEAKRCARYIVDSLSQDDTLSLVAYDHDVDVLVDSRNVKDRELFHHMIGQIHSRGATALHEGWLEGAGQAARKADQNQISRVLLLSDGMANRGITDIHGIAKHCAEMADVGVTTSTYGLSHHFNEDLMVEMAKSGQGNSYYGETAEDLMDPFREEFDLLSSIYGRGLRLSLEASEGIELRMLNDYQKDQGGRWILPDLALCGEAWSLARLHIPEHLISSSSDELVKLLKVSLEYSEMGGDAVTVEDQLELTPVDAEAYSAITVDSYVQERARELRFAEIQREARTAARQHDWDQVSLLLAQAELEAKDNPWLQDGLKALKRYARQRHTERFAKEAHYSSRKMASRLVDPRDVPGMYDEKIENSKAGFLRRKREQGKEQ